MFGPDDILGRIFDHFLARIAWTGGPAWLTAA
jgi:hypothetical protein